MLVWWFELSDAVGVTFAQNRSVVSEFSQSDVRLGRRDHCADLPSEGDANGRILTLWIVNGAVLLPSHAPDARSFVESASVSQYNEE